MASASTDPAFSRPDPIARLRSQAYLRLLVFAAVLAVPVSAAAFGFLKLVSLMQGWVFTDLPKGVGFDRAPVCGPSRCWPSPASWSG